MYHGIIIDQEFIDQEFINSFKIFAKKQDGSWRIYGIEIDDSQLQEVINKIQKNMKSEGTWYAHLYNDERLIVLFKNKVFDVKPHANSWKPIIDFGKRLNIPGEQLDFWPNRFQDESHYFSDGNLK
ncbi:TPA: hypothetical protein DHW62_02205 [candidate division WWE3 bacterium]|uniref:Uncharacterized protein n=1 Tax=candidate division WWE3 bacterium TaxID=2053526 RepID=A0A656PPC4_UNCKA|nr:hypothetical protein P147_WWE3C00001G0762 [candidate division WWE3 bacterium RAAC2_WWE3_1]KKS29174.1 MAG: hypothetical protein UU91_C0008G0038 [candidate division WWE3 bacterium GW2011_GWB1_42_117]KKS54760.1 MAG: hypothetical protein UV21_C0005G0124 [candidate division WWE3 bacterium GW2011_GWD2_42_34]KKT05196.1 MAG: hypothetical protein UV83_C0006G0025 [candidate division WWE3 bacterium GW2011_GWE2_43_18]KKT06463.1 MAG: hypothetical protein UV84_C0007G0025 [candidate division WWE3 bacterium